MEGRFFYYIFFRVKAADGPTGRKRVKGENLKSTFVYAPSAVFVCLKLKRVIGLWIADHLNKEQKKKLNKIKKEEKINWSEMMGINRQTYKRVRGAIRRK